MARKPEGYWEKRSTDLMLRLEKGTEKTIDNLVKVYNQATKNINKEINNIFRNYASGTGLSKEALTSMLNKRETDAYYEKLFNTIQKIKNEDVRKKLLAKYNAPAYSYRIKRFQALQDNIDVEIAKIADIEQTITKERYVDTIKEGYYHNIYDIQKGLGYGFNFSKIDTKTINLMLNERWAENGNFSSRIWKNADRLSNYLKINFTADTMSGKSISAMSKELSDTLNIGLYKSTRLIRTEVNHFANESEMLSYEELGIEKYRFVATLDNVTCKHCAQLDNKVFNVKDRQAGKNYPPLHPNDRCTTVVEFDEEEIEGLKRRATDPITGKTYLVDQNITYDEWKQQIDDKYGKGTLDIEHKKYTNLKLDKQQYQKYNKTIEEEYMPKTFEKFQEMKYNNIEKYNDLKGYYRYKSNYPESNRQYYEINNKIKQCINLEKISPSIGTAIKPNTNGITIGSINTHAQNRMAKRGVTKKDAQSYIENAIIEFSQNTKKLYLSNEGATVLLKEDKRLISTYSKKDFDDGIKEILKVMNNGK